MQLHAPAHWQRNLNFIQLEMRERENLNELTWILIILGKGCFVLAPPSMAIPSIGFVFLTVICKFPLWSGTTCGLCSWFGSFANPFGCSPDKRCIDCTDANEKKKHQTFSMNVRIESGRMEKSIKSTLNPPIY